MKTYRKNTAFIITLTLSLAAAASLSGCHFYNIKRDFCTNDPKDKALPQCEKKAAGPAR